MGLTNKYVAFAVDSNCIPPRQWKTDLADNISNENQYILHIFFFSIAFTHSSNKIDLGLNRFSRINLLLNVTDIRVLKRIFFRAIAKLISRYRGREEVSPYAKSDSVIGTLSTCTRRWKGNPWKCYPGVRKMQQQQQRVQSFWSWHATPPESVQPQCADYFAYIMHVCIFIWESAWGAKSALRRVFRDHWLGGIGLALLRMHNRNRESSSTESWLDVLRKRREMKLGLGGRQQRLAELNNSSNEDSIVGEQCKTEGGCNTALDNDRLIGINVPRDTNCTYIF